MDEQGRTFLLLQVFFCFVVFASAEETKQNCSQTNCRGLLMYYKDMGCTPVYRNEGDCCAYKYNCDHLNARLPNKCYIKHKSYEIEEYVLIKDENNCALICTCSNGTNSKAHFVCSFYDYFYPRTVVGCYVKREVSRCGPKPLVCPKNESEISRCVVDGVTYKRGEFFTPRNESQKECVCHDGYEGQNIEPFCLSSDVHCISGLLCNDQRIAMKCAPLYSTFRSLATGCNEQWRCPTEHDTVIPNPKISDSLENEIPDGNDTICKFGNLMMNVGDELSRSTDPLFIRVRCICEIPPTPTCRFTY